MRRPSRHNKPPLILWVVLGLVLAGGLVFLIVKLAGGGGKPEEGPASSVGAASTDPAPEAGEPAPAPTPTPEPVALPEPDAPEGAPEDMGSLMVAGGTGYAYYTFSTEVSNRYINTVAGAGQALAGSATVYSLIAPTSMDVQLPESYLTEHQVDSADQKKAIDRYLLPSINAINQDVKTVPVFDALRRHWDENIYFGTDRTWTQLGAYYAYEEFCKAKGVQAVALDQFEKKSYEGFMGGFAGLVGEDRLYSDTVDAYIPAGDTSLSFTDANGETNEGWAVISDGDGYSSSLLYLIFAAGDQPYKVLTNNSITDGSACVVVQDSFGNFFTPFLTQHYQFVYVVDYASYDGNVPDLVREKGAGDLIFLNHVIITSSDTAVESLESLF
ncbi:DHHW family protein [Acutalibacter caecimuris]|uniref:DHHW family protein n=1 Tax=Acutalibacter caecimuris TaxID=3093657 RepID=UPI002AC9C851|nr:DHHW family protein [Acutalibacter sp. M00118]